MSDHTLLLGGADHLSLTIRQIFYRLVGAHGYEKTEQAYDRLIEYGRPKIDSAADLPVQQSTKTELVINLKTAKALTAQRAGRRMAPVHGKPALARTRSGLSKG